MDMGEELNQLIDTCLINLWIDWHWFS